MKFKKIFLITLLLLAVLTISSVSAIEDNATNEIINIEDTSNDEPCLENTSKNVLTRSNTNDSEIEEDTNNNKLASTNENLLTSNDFTTPDDYSSIPYEFHVYTHSSGGWICQTKAPSVTAKYKETKYFKITVKRLDGKYVKNVKLTLKMEGKKYYKTFTVKTNNKGIAKFNTNKLKKDTYKVYVLTKNFDYNIYTTSKITIKKGSSKKTNSKKKTTTTKKKSNLKSITIKIKSPKSPHAIKKLKTGDILHTVYSKGGQYYKGVYAEVMDYDYPIHTKIKKVKFYFKNKNTGKIKTKIVKKIRNGKQYSGAKTSLISGYIPYKAKVWYKKA